MGNLAISEDDLYEYVFYINVGNSMSQVMYGLAVGNGARYAQVPL
jgi:hypothetical protein